MNAYFSTKARVGLLVLLALLLFAFGVVTVGSRSKLFMRSTEYVVSFRSVAGLKPGAPVQMHGVHIGTVKEVALLPDPALQRIDVTVSIEKRYEPLVRADTVAQIKTLGLLGDKYVLLSSERKPDAARISAGGNIPAVEQFDYDELLRQSEDVITNTAIISASLRQLLLSLQKGESLLGRIISDPAYGDKVGDDIAASFADARAIIGGAREGKGLAGRFLSDEEFARTVSADVQDAAARMSRLLAAAESGDSMAGKFFSSNAEGRKMFDDMSRFADALGEVADAFKKDEGLLSAFLKGGEESRRSVEDFHRAIRHMSSILKKVDEGEGSASGFINNPDIYEAVEDIVLGIRDSRLTKWYLRRKAVQGQKQREEDAKKAEKEKASRKESGKKKEESAPVVIVPPDGAAAAAAAPPRFLTPEEIRDLFARGVFNEPSETLVTTHAPPRDPFAGPPSS